MIETSAPISDMTSADVNTCGLGDITFKSFVCPGGEVELSASVVCAEESIVLPLDQAAYYPETEDTVTSDSMMVQSCDDHVDHPYYIPEVMNASSVDTDTACQCEISNDMLASRSLDESDCCGEQDVTWKSVVCDGGEVEVADVTRQHDETIPLPQAQLGEPSEDSIVNTADLSVCSQMFEAEHADHPYCGSTNGAPVNTTFSDIPDGFEKPASGLSDVTFKSFICAGGEIEISDGTKLVNETIPLPADCAVTSSLSHSYSINQSVSDHNDDAQNGNDHLDHPYCNSENYSSLSSANIPTAQEPLPCSTDAMDDVKQRSLVVPDSQTCTQETVAFGSLIGAGGEVEDSNDTQVSEKTFPLLDDLAVICQSQDDDHVPAPVSQDQIQDDCEQPNCHVESEATTHSPAVTTSLLSNTSLKAPDNKSINCHVEETSMHSIHPEDCTLPPVLHQTESSDLSKPVASAKTPAPVEAQQHLEHTSEMHLSSGLPESSQTKDSALGSTGNGPALSNSLDNPQAEQLPDVLKVLSQCPSVASMLQYGVSVFSPVVRRASLAVSKARHDPAFDHFLADDSALEGEKSLLAPVDADLAGLWAEHLESPMPRPLLNSTALGYKPRSGPASEGDDGVGLKPCTAPQSEVEKPVLDFPLIPDGPLQQQLRQMAEFLLLASGKMGPAAVCAPAPAPTPAPAVVTVPSPAETHSVCVGTSAVNLVDRSLNTSGQFERKRDFSVVDSCTLTDPLLWK